MIEEHHPDPAHTSAAPDSPSVPRAIGRIASPPGHEATTARFSFWVAPGELVEKGQLVTTESEVGGHTLRFFGVIDEVYRRSRSRGMDEEVDLFDGDLDYQPPFQQEGLTYAEAMTTGTAPPLLTPPIEQSPVWLGDETDARVAFGYDEMIDLETGVDWGVPIGVLRNGGAATLGIARVDLRDLCGYRAGHLNVTGQAGRGTKSSFLLVVVRSLIDTAIAWDDGDPRRDRFSVRPIVFNVKGNDLMYIDAPNRHLTDSEREVWTRMGISPRPFEDAEFFAPCASGNNRGNPRILRKVRSERQTQLLLDIG